jgi:hypothetical protein
MRDEDLLTELLEAETESTVLNALESRGLFGPEEFSKRWRFLGRMQNNQAIVLAQQSAPVAALVEKYTNAVDSILLRHCKAAGVDPRGPDAPPSMTSAVDRFLGDLDSKEQDEIRRVAEENIVLYATGRKDRPTISLYDGGEGQLAQNFPKTFCSLIAFGEEGAYKKGVPFVQGQFNMGGSGVLPFCSEQRRLQLVVSRVPADVAKTDEHEWAFTLFCFFEKEASWCYLVGDDGSILTAGAKPRALLPKAGPPKEGEVPLPRVRNVKSGTLIKMFDFQAPKSNICGELAKKIEEYLLRPPLPMRIIECRSDYEAKVMAVSAWDHMGRWKKRSKKFPDGRLEPGFEEGASFEIELANGEKVPGEIRVFRADTNTRSDDDPPQTGVRALINGQSHAKRDWRFFAGRRVDKEHVARSMLVTLMCESLSRSTKNELFMSNRETFRDSGPGSILAQLLDELQTILKTHDELIRLNERRYAEEIKDSVRDQDGIKALEELLGSEPSLANLFGSLIPGSIPAPSSAGNQGGTVLGKPIPFKGVDFPTFFCRVKDKATTVDVELPQGDAIRVSFATDVKNNYFTRRRPPRGDIDIDGSLRPSYALYNGRLTFACRCDKASPVGTTFSTVVTITDKRGSGPFVLQINSTVVAPREEREPQPGKKREQKVKATPSQPNVTEKALGPDEPPLKIVSTPGSQEQLQIIINTTSPLLEEAKRMRSKAEERAVTFVFKYGLALAAMGMLSKLRGTPQWESHNPECRTQIQTMAEGVARVIVPLCLSLSKNLPKVKAGSVAAVA